ncbi:MAG: 8-amino-7-oxononanoate synthase [Planctomycetes bacterium]|nr:8-amino-7-oxononanoate synthase [Planctomycetota bacterium]
MLDFVKRELKSLRQAGLIREFKAISAIKGSRVKIGGKWYVSFCTNDYLGLSQHPRVIEAARRALKEVGWGSGASRLMAGTFSYHKELEKEIARFKGAQSALLFTSGYAANLGVITTLVKKDDIIFCDELNHASLVDSARLTKARLYIYKHRDASHLEEGLKKLSNNYKLKSNIYIITDAIFSMDGDAAPLKEITRLAKKYKAVTIADEAHGTGVLGKHGRGLAEHLGLEKQVDISIGTLSKAAGNIGGFVTGSRNFISYLKSKSRPFIFTTALPMPACAAGIEGLRIIRDMPSLRKKLWYNTNYVKERLKKLNFDFRGSITPIIPIMVAAPTLRRGEPRHSINIKGRGNAKKTLAISQYLWNKGLFIPAIRPPTVPHGESRLRITITAMHTRKELDWMLECLVKSLRD